VEPAARAAGGVGGGKMIRHLEGAAAAYAVGGTPSAVLYAVWALRGLLGL